MEQWNINLKSNQGNVYNLYKLYSPAALGLSMVTHTIPKIIIMQIVLLNKRLKCYDGAMAGNGKRY